MEAVLQRCSYEKVFRKYAANLPENSHAKVWFQLSCYKTLFKSHFNMGALLQVCCLFSEQLSIGTPLVNCFWIIDVIIKFLSGPFNYYNFSKKNLACPRKFVCSIIQYIREILKVIVFQYFYGNKVEVFIQIICNKNLIKSTFHFYCRCLQGLTQRDVEKLIINIFKFHQHQNKQNVGRWYVKLLRVQKMY